MVFSSGKHNKTKQTVTNVQAARWTVLADIRTSKEGQRGGLSLADDARHAGKAEHERVEEAGVRGYAQHRCLGLCGLRARRADDEPAHVEDGTHQGAHGQLPTLKRNGQLGRSLSHKFKCNKCFDIVPVRRWSADTHNDPIIARFSGDRNMLIN